MAFMIEIENISDRRPCSWPEGRAVLRADGSPEQIAALFDLARDLVEVEISTDLADAPADVYAEIVTAYVDPFSLEGCP